ncbi:hypothetical protein LOTGIDRAFT_236498 [Lottia gigantea]|uniref:RUN domain-containing protein n=1 Tax=Lottia gigantea TaxID=225164 RepID=V4B5B4_LOTGI|nr:hypothetical protein LOTGIDRAFT_236498 [Lottia gigantea]ESO83659.1 hypothetical protein LOTGIDRAFT_236498 [Lottia gigantea]
MSFLKKKRVPTQAELLRENKIKKNLTKEFSISLKNLQQKHLNSDEPVYSDDVANHLCGVLEAVFLHGLRDSVTAKIASYVNFSNDHENQVNTNFWIFVTKFTHKDVISQLKHLGQITTEIGLSRAWIRLSLNDGLMESYIESMVTDKRTLDYFYQPTSYLLDIEQPGILTSYMKGLLELQFILSYNSSVLNSWTTTPLSLAGIIEKPNITIAVIDSSSDQAKPVSSAPTLKQPESPIRVVKNRSRTKSRGNSDPDVPGTSVPKVPPNTPFASSGFTRQDVEDIKKLTVQSRHSISESSNSSHISCPDNSSSEQPIISPSRTSFLMDQNFDDIPKTSRTENDRSIKSEIAEVEITEEYTATKTVVSKDAEATTEELSIVNVVEVTTTTTHSEHQHHHAKKKKTKAVDLPSYESLNCSPKKKSAPIEPTLSDVVAETIDTVAEQDLPPISHVREHIRRHSSPKITPQETFIACSPRSFGNNLNSMDSWSSPVEQEDYLTDLPRERTSSTSQDIPQRMKSESFGTLLKNYTPTTAVSSSLDEVLNNLDNQDPNDSSQDQVDKARDVTDNESVDIALEDYEVIPNSALHKQDEGILAVKKQQMCEIATEKGLDAQNYQCKDCKRPIGLFYGKPRVCAFDGGYYCFECHENEEFYIPALIVHNWDFRKQQVSRNNLKFLMEYEEEALLDISDINPKLYSHVPEMEELKLLRTQLFYLKTYLFTCNQAMAEELRKRVWPREFLYDDIHVYSLGDFFHVYSGQLARSLKEINKFAMNHVYDCLLCSQKGFICEICSSKKVIYPFETDTTHRCSICNAVFHKTCMSEQLPCPRCQRWRRRQNANHVSKDAILMLNLVSKLCLQKPPFIAVRVCSHYEQRKVMQRRADQSGIHILAE